MREWPQNLLDGLTLSVGYGDGHGVDHPGLSGMARENRADYVVFQVILHRSYAEQWRVGFHGLHAEAMARGALKVGP